MPQIAYYIVAIIAAIAALVVYKRNHRRTISLVIKFL